MATQHSSSRRPNPKAATAASAVEVKPILLAELHFDGTNPRFGTRPMGKADDEAILDEIVRRFGVEDVLSSIAANGYLGTEPLVGLRNAEGIRIIEGNRRLA